MTQMRPPGPGEAFTSSIAPPVATVSGFAEPTFQSRTERHVG